MDQFAGQVVFVASESAGGAVETGQSDQAVAMQDAVHGRGGQAQEGTMRARPSSHTRPDGTAPRTQSERVEYARELRSRRAERQWVLAHTTRIRRVAAQLAAVEGLQQRADRSREAQVMQTLRSHGKQEPPPQEPLVWPNALRECGAEDRRLRTAPAPVEDDLAAFQRQQQEADIAHRLLGLISYAASARNIDLSDLPDLADAIFDLHNDSQQTAKPRR